MIVIPKETDPNDVAIALATYVVDHCELTHRGFSSVGEQIKNVLGARILLIVMNRNPEQVEEVKMLRS